MKGLLGKLDSVKGSKRRGNEVKDISEGLFHKFMEQIEIILSSLPRPKEW